MTTAELPDDLNDYYKSKARDLPTRKRNTVDDLIDALDDATILMLNHGVPLLQSMKHSMLYSIIQTVLGNRKFLTTVNAKSITNNLYGEVKNRLSMELVRIRT